MSPKIEFRRGYFVDPVTRKLDYSVGGIYLKHNEEIVQSEMLMYVPLRATFSEHMIRAHIPWLQKFIYGQSARLWMSFGLAALIAHFPDVVGPWAALLPDVTTHPILWPESEVTQLLGTRTYESVNGIRKIIAAGCDRFMTHLDSLDITCRQVAEAYAIIMSRAFGLEIATGDARSAIPFGPDLLNHSPHSVSWISLVDPPPSAPYQSAQQILESSGHVIYYLRSYVLGNSRELFNNYGQHGLSMDMAMYGFTAPDNSDELVIVSSLHGVFDGVHIPYTQREVCPKPWGNLGVPTTHTCSLAHYNAVEARHDTAGYYRLTNNDYLSFFPSRLLQCKNTVGGPQWVWMVRELRRLNVQYDEHQYLLHLNVIDGAEPHMNHATSVWMAICALPPSLPFHIVSRVIEELSLCKPVHTSAYYQYEEYPLHPAIRNLAKKTLLDLCVMYHTAILDDHLHNFVHWISARNELCRRRGCQKKKRLDVNVDFINSRSFMTMLRIINANKNRIWTDNGGVIDYLSASHKSNRASYLFRREELFKLKMQVSYMLFQKCRSPLEAVVHQKSVFLLGLA